MKRWVDCFFHDFEEDQALLNIYKGFLDKNIKDGGVVSIMKTNVEKKLASLSVMLCFSFYFNKAGKTNCKNKLQLQPASTCTYITSRWRYHI